MNDYKQEYQDFLKSYKRGTTDAEEVGLLIATFAMYFAEMASKKAAAEIAYNITAAEGAQVKDGDSGKSISSAKATVLSEATPQYADLAFAKADLDSVEQMINALKSLQKGLSNEFQYSNAG